MWIYFYLMHTNVYSNVFNICQYYISASRRGSITTPGVHYFPIIQRPVIYYIVQNIMIFLYFWNKYFMLTMAAVIWSKIKNIVKCIKIG